MTFITEDFLLETESAKQLYFGFAKDQPIIDYHCHLSPKDIAEDRKFENITEIWLEGDHYKWRAMRNLGIEEKFITGNAPDQEKFRKWAECVPHTLRNPLYHWTHLELKRYFDIENLLDGSSADYVYEKTAALLNSPEYSVRSLLKKMNVEVVCTTDDPVDNLASHEYISGESFEIQILPAFRPDNCIMLDKEGYGEYIQTLSEVSGVEINTLDNLLEALSVRLDYFHERGCRLSDHGLQQIRSGAFELDIVRSAFKKRIEGKDINAKEAKQFYSFLLEHLSREYHDRGWVQQFHLGALRNTNRRLLQELGPDTGFDSIGDFEQASSLAAHLNRLEESESLAKTILYNLNPSDNEVFATMIGNFYQEGVKGKMQFGSGWWFNDQKDGMEKQINTLSNMGLLSCFVGMLTDSRSFMSFPRHEYFRRILCNIVGNDIEKGLVPNDMELLGGMVANICYFNARNYFNFQG
jgi:glucuronate isomerase